MHFSQYFCMLFSVTHKILPYLYISIELWLLLLMHYHVYLLDIRKSRWNVRLTMHCMFSIEAKKKGNVFFIQISSYYYSIECISNRSEFVHVRAATSEESVKDLLQNNPSNNSHSRAMPLPLFIADKKNVHYTNLIFFNCLRLLCSLVFVVVVGRKTTSCIHFFAIRKYFHFYWISSWLTEGKCYY